MVASDALRHRGIVSGFGNSITGVGASVLGGYLNNASGPATVIAAGALNSAEAHGAAIFGGTEHQAFGTVNQDWMTIVGGYRNEVTAWGATVTGGVNLTVSTPTSWMAGGNTFPAYFAP